jgi:SAM-dependent methyltransferase
MTTTAEPWHRQFVGSLWNQVGALQFKFLVDNGLQSQHRLLDVGCGSLRGGIHFIRYLDRGNYTGIDASLALLSAGKDVELREAGLEGKSPRLVQMNDFSFGAWQQTFDYAIAQSLFTHVSLNSIMLCLSNVDAVLAPGGVFFATFFENERGRSNITRVLRTAADGPFWTYFDRDPFHYDLETLRWAAKGTSLELEYVGEWNHPRQQRMLRFVRRADKPGQ